MTQASGAPDPIPMRIGDTERNSALEALGEHLAAGRLDIDEYGERSARVTVARTTADLTALFSDLPAPHPRFSAATATPAVRPEAVVSPAPADPRIVPGGADTRTTAQKVMAAAVPLTAIIAVGLFFWLHVWVVFLLPAAMAVITGAVWGNDNDYRNRGRRRRLGPGSR